MALSFLAVKAKRETSVCPFSLEASRMTHRDLKLLVHCSWALGLKQERGKGKKLLNIETRLILLGKDGIL